MKFKFSFSASEKQELTELAEQQAGLKARVIELAGEYKSAGDNCNSAESSVIDAQAVVAELESRLSVADVAAAELIVDELGDAEKKLMSARRVSESQQRIFNTWPGQRADEIAGIQTACYEITARRDEITQPHRNKAFADYIGGRKNQLFSKENAIVLAELLAAMDEANSDEHGSVIELARLFELHRKLPVKKSVGIPDADSASADVNMDELLCEPLRKLSEQAAAQRASDDKRRKQQQPFGFDTSHVMETIVAG